MDLIQAVKDRNTLGGWPMGLNRWFFAGSRLGTAPKRRLESPE